MAPADVVKADAVDAQKRRLESAGGDGIVTARR
jgi:hypothetical protein